MQVTTRMPLLPLAAYLFSMQVVTWPPKVMLPVLTVPCALVVSGSQLRLGPSIPRACRLTLWTPRAR